jgi:hypothetical protein
MVEYTVRFCLKFAFLKTTTTTLTSVGMCSTFKELTDILHMPTIMYPIATYGAAFCSENGEDVNCAISLFCFFIQRMENM